MADNTNTLQLTLQVKDDGSIVIDQVAGKIKGMGDETEKASSKSSGMLSKLKENWLAVAAGATAGYLAITRVTESLYTNIKTAASLTNEIDRQSQVIGMTTDAFQKYQFIAKMSDVSNDNLAIGLKILSRNMEEVSRGTGLTKGYFDAMGISVTTTSGKLKPLDQIMGEIADKFSTWENGPRKIAIAMELFGRSGETLIPMLNKGKSGFEEFSKEAEKLGIILSPGIVKKGSEAKDIFKRMEAQMEALKKSFYPTAFEATKAADSIFRDFNRLNDWLKTNKTTDWFPWFSDINKWIKENSLDNWLTKLGLKVPKVTYDIKQLTKEMVSAPTIEPITPPDPNRVREWLSTYHVYIDTLNEMGIVNERFQVNQAKETIANMKLVEAAYHRGEASVKDYLNALKAASDASKKLKPEDDLKKRIDLEEQYQKAIRAISPEEPERGKKVQEQIDIWLKGIKDLEAAKGPTLIDVPELKKNIAEGERYVDDFQKQFKNAPIEIPIDNEKIKIQMDDIQYEYLALKDKIERTPIEVKIKSSLSGGGAGELENLYESNMGLVTGAFADQNFDVKLNFWGEGSTKKPIMDKIKEIMGGFTNIQEKANAMETVIKFQGLTTQLRDLQKQYDSYQGIIEEYTRNIRRFSFLTDPETNPTVINARNLQTDLFEQMKSLRLQMAEQKYLLGIPGSEEEFYSIFKSKYQSSFQTGTPYVPYTGLALVHQGERITPANQNSFSMGGIVLNFNINGTGKQVAEEIAHTLEYHLSGRLRDAIKKIR